MYKNRIHVTDAKVNKIAGTMYKSGVMQCMYCLHAYSYPTNIHVVISNSKCQKHEWTAG